MKVTGKKEMTEIAEEDVTDEVSIEIIDTEDNTKTVIGSTGAKTEVKERV